MKEQATICVAYTGEVVNDGTMDVSELAPALLALGRVDKSFKPKKNRSKKNKGKKTISEFIKAHSYAMILF